MARRKRSYENSTPSVVTDSRGNAVKSGTGSDVTSRGFKKPAAVVVAKPKVKVAVVKPKAKAKPKPTATYRKAGEQHPEAGAPITVHKAPSVSVSVKKPYASPSADASYKPGRRYPDSQVTSWMRATPTKPTLAPDPNRRNHKAYRATN
jgi:hypothetical protein